MVGKLDEFRVRSADITELRGSELGEIRLKFWVSE
jgi:hypothetical protein